jgi:hypothetical protein
MRATARLLIPTLLLTACAQVGELSGGEKDSSAPRLLRSIPEQAGTGFSGDRILLEFDERIQLDRVAFRGDPVERSLGGGPDLHLQHR